MNGLSADRKTGVIGGISESNKGEGNREKDGWGIAGSGMSGGGRRGSEDTV